jgi:hypothetical protein
MYTCGNCPLFWVLSEAYDLQPFEYAGPDWPQNARFDFAAKLPAVATKETFRKMLQNLLEERFKLAAHREMKPMTAYEMRIRSDGQTMAWFAHLLSGQLHTPVVDATGMVGKYDFLLSWSFEDNSAGDGAEALISAVQLELGLKLQQKRGQGEVLVVDRLEKTPSGN